MNDIPVIIVNGVERSISTPESLADIVESLTARTQGCAVAINGDVVPRSTWTKVMVQSGDRLEILTAAPGG